MSTPTKEAQDGAGEKHEDELDEQTEVDGGTAAATPAKRGRGRPKGSKNKKSGATSPSAPAAGSSTATPRKRGRPPKEKKEESGAEEPPQKRKRGRPPKVPQPDAAGEGTTSGDGAESSTKKKRGRPPKNAST